MTEFYGCMLESPVVREMRRRRPVESEPEVPASDEPDPAAEEQRRPYLSQMNRDELLAVIDEEGIQTDLSAPKSVLRTAIRRARGG